MRATQVLVGGILVAVAVWFGASTAAVLTGAEGEPAIGPTVLIGVLAIGVGIAVGRRSAQRRDTTYW